MGGRGASSTYGDQGVTTGDDGRPLTFYDQTEKYRGMTVQEFEKKVVNRKNEYVGLADENGRIIIAGTSYNHGAVAVPTTHPDFNKARTLTHNHPYMHDGRQLGGSFSGADVKNHVTLNLQNSRAVSKEKTYIISRKNPTAKQTANMYKKGTTSDSVWSKQSGERLKRITKRLNSNGKSLSSATRNRISYGYGTRLWKNLSRNSGYEYVEIRPKNRGF